jgi:multidrug transporter EmrE-like cation transporter
VNSLKIAAIVLIMAGVVGLGYGGFSYTRKTHEITMGPIEMSVQEKRTVNVPVWAGVGAIALGAALLLIGGRKA